MPLPKRFEVYPRQVVDSVLSYASSPADIAFSFLRWPQVRGSVFRRQYSALLTFMVCGSISYALEGALETLEGADLKLCLPGSSFFLICYQSCFTLVKLWSSGFVFIANLVVLSLFGFPRYLAVLGCNHTRGDCFLSVPKTCNF